MATQSPSPSPFSRLSRFASPFKTNSSSPASDPNVEDWYIPYNGPLEPPKDERNTDSWGHLVSGWLMEEDDGGLARAPPRPRTTSNASRMTAERKNSRVQTSFIKLDHAGGVGDVPIPARPRRSQEAPVQHRASFAASILSFGKQKSSSSSRRLQHSTSAGTLEERGRETGDAPTSSYKQGREDRPSFPHSQPEATPAPEFSVRRHPYAYAAPAGPLSPVTPPSPALTSPRAKAPKFSVQLLEPLARKPSAPAYLLPATRPSRLSLKASMSTPNLRTVTGTGPLPKGKQRWFSAETWCDALILPRPRFALKVDDGEGGSGRIVSPPPTPTWAPGMEPGAGKPVKLKKSHSAMQLSSRPPPPSPPRPPRIEEQPRAGPSILPKEQPTPPPPPPPPEKEDTHLKPSRPKSFALDDLALPSPVPSLAKVLEDGRKLDEDRKAWQHQAARSLDKRARSYSRARSKSLGQRAASHARNQSMGEALTEATLLGGQRRRPTVHVRVKGSRSDGHATSSGGGTNTITGTGTGTGLGTFTSASHGQTKSRSQHGHSNSAGSIKLARSDDSFMWAPGHGRNRSFGKSALHMVRTTATTAAGFCGFNGSPSDDGKERNRPPLNDKAAAMEEALRTDGTKVIHLRDQVARERRQLDDGIVIVTPPPDTGDTQTSGFSAHLGPGGAAGLSPTPSASAVSTSAEGVGIAISSPLSTPQSHEDVFAKEPIRIPAHPYAQGSASHPYYQRTAGRTRIQTDVRAAQNEASLPSPSGSTGRDSITRHRQPVKHPYSPYTQVQHPFAAITGTSNDARPGPGKQAATAGKQQSSKHLDARPSPLSSMYAELSPGTIREILPEEIQYSPFIPTPPVRVAEFPTAPAALAAHPYGLTTNRVSEWGFADALNYTMVRRSSEDSGVGTSEAHEVPPVPVAPERQERLEHPTPRRVLDDWDGPIVLSPAEEDFEEDGLNPHLRSGSGIRSRIRERLGVSSHSNHTLASSGIEHPPAFRKELSAGEQSFNSTRSSPGFTSTQSSPPLSPHLFQNGDLQEFQDLFYKPENRTPPDERLPISRNQSGSIPIELNERSTRSVSGLTTLARQLSDDLEEMQYDEETDRIEPMWGTRHEGLAGDRPEDLGPDLHEVLSQSSSPSEYRDEDTQSPLRLPIDDDLVLSQPVDVVPADVESSRASSMLEMPLEDNFVDVRVGEIEAVSTPSVFAQPERFSTHVIQMVDYGNTQLSPADTHPRERVVSGQSSLAVPPLSSDATRSSFMTTTSGMSRLSDFPSPPSLITAGHLSILNAYYGDGSRNSRIEEQDSSGRVLVREPSHSTFGSGRQQMGEAL